MISSGKELMLPNKAIFQNTIDFHVSVFQHSIWSLKTQKSSWISEIEDVGREGTEFYAVYSWKASKDTLAAKMTHLHLSRMAGDEKPTHNLNKKGHLTMIDIKKWNMCFSLVFFFCYYKRYILRWYILIFFDLL